MLIGKNKQKTSKFNRFFGGKGGFTLAELSVVLAIVAIVGTMVASFSGMMGKHRDSIEDQYDFLNDCATFKNTFLVWVSEYDTAGATFTVDGGKLAVDGKKVEFSSIAGTLSFAGKKLENLKSIREVKFTAEGELIKCTLTAKEDADKTESSFVFSLRSATIGGAT